MMNDARDFKLAFLFLTKGPMPLEPLWRRFFAFGNAENDYSIYIHPPKGWRVFSLSLPR